MEYLRNAWYVAALPDEVKQGEILGRRILGEYIALYRDNEGVARALIDRCSHRFAPLSLGKLTENGVECPYHGFRYNSSGECIHNPHGDGRVPARSSIRAYPTLERYNAIWIWMGEPDRADADLVPVFDFMNPDVNYVGAGYLHVEGNYLLENDNILDLSHIEFLHPVFSSPAVSRGEVSHEIVGDTVWSKRDIYNDETPPDFIRKVFNVPSGPVDRWLYVHWQAPSYLALEASGMASGQSRENAIGSMQVHWFTPETATTTHYWYGLTLPKSLGPQAEAMVQEDVKTLYVPFKLEDAPLIEGQQRNLGERDIMELKPIILNVDAAGNAARRILERLIAEEGAEASA